MRTAANEGMRCRWVIGSRISNSMLNLINFQRDCLWDAFGSRRGSNLINSNSTQSISSCDKKRRRGEGHFFYLLQTDCCVEVEEEVLLKERRRVAPHSEQCIQLCKSCASKETSCYLFVSNVCIFLCFIERRSQILIQKLIIWDPTSSFICQPSPMTGPNWLH